MPIQQNIVETPYLDLLHVLSELGITAAMVVAPAIIMLWWLHIGLKRKFQPFRLTLAFTMGVLCVVPVAMIVLPVKELGSNFAFPFMDTAYRAFCSASMVEETFKLLALVSFVIITRAHKSPISIVVFGAAVALGFATFENLMYVAEEGLATAVIRALTAVPCHGCLGAISGYYLAQFCFQKRFSALFKAWLVPVLLHGMYDLPLMVGYLGDSAPNGRGTVLLAMLTLCLLILWTRYVVNSVHNHISNSRQNA
jgi:protease PrsW